MLYRSDRPQPILRLTSRTTLASILLLDALAIIIAGAALAIGA